MGFFSIPVDIRLQIYEELLVASEPIDFQTNWDPSWPPLSLARRCCLCPAVLQTSKQVQREATPILYSANCFRFIQLEPVPRLQTESAAISWIFSQMGQQNAALIRHISVAFPAFDDYSIGNATIQEDSMKTLELISQSCTSIATLETSLYDAFRLEFAELTIDSSPIAVEALDLVAAQFKTISWLQEVVIHVYVSEGLSDNLKKKMLDYGWKVKVTDVGESISEEDEFDFEGYLEMSRQEEEAGEQEWIEEYHRRRRDPYWKNDSDYD